MATGSRRTMTATTTTPRWVPRPATPTATGSRTRRAPERRVAVCPQAARRTRAGVRRAPAVPDPPCTRWLRRRVARTDGDARGLRTGRLDGQADTEREVLVGAGRAVVTLRAPVGRVA